MLAPRFLQCSVRQLLLLVAVSSVLLGILTPRIHRTFHLRRLQEERLRHHAANAALIVAVQANQRDRARQALEAGADPNLNVNNSANSQSLLGTCILNGQIEMMELLLDYGSDLERIEYALGTPASPFRGPIYGGPPLFIAAGCNQPPDVRAKMIRLLLRRGANARLEYSGYTAMDFAFHSSDAQTADVLREYDVPYTPREMAAFNRLDELKAAVQEAPQILRQRYRPTWASYPEHGPTLLAIALERGYREMAFFLIESGAPLDTVVYRGSTLLHQAARSGDPDLIRLLVSRGLDVTAIDVYRDTPLTIAASQDKPQAVAALVEAGSGVNHRDANGSNALHFAVWRESRDIVGMLLAAGADPVLPNDKCETPLDLARKRRSATTKLLEQAAEREP